LNWSIGDLRILALNLCHFSSRIKQEQKHIRAVLPIFYERSAR
jgi:hypothetical protein